MSTEAIEFIQTMSNDREAVGFVPGVVLGDVLRAWSTLYGSGGVLRVRLPYRPGRKDRQLASVLLQALGQPPLKQGVSTAKAWEKLTSLCRECACRLVVIENADLLDRDGLACVSRRILPAVVLVGGERLAQQIARNATFAQDIVSWGATSPGVA